MFSILVILVNRKSRALLLFIFQFFSVVLFPLLLYFVAAKITRHVRLFKEYCPKKAGSVREEYVFGFITIRVCQLVGAISFICYFFGSGFVRFKCKGAQQGN
jgi:hypothetical protein